MAWCYFLIGRLADATQVLEAPTSDTRLDAMRYIIGVELIDRVEASLTKRPAIGRAGRVLGTRELVIGELPYVVPYRVREQDIEILRVLHTSRRWPYEL